MKPIPMPARLLAAVLLSVPATQGMAATLRLNQFDAWTRADADGNGGLTREEAHRMPRLARHFDAIDGIAPNIRPPF